MRAIRIVTDLLRVNKEQQTKAENQNAFEIECNTPQACMHHLFRHLQ